MGSPGGFGLSGPPVPLAEIEESLGSNTTPRYAGYGGPGGLNAGDLEPVSPSEMSPVSGDAGAGGKGLRAFGAEAPQADESYRDASGDEAAGGKCGQDKFSPKRRP